MFKNNKLLWALLSGVIFLLTTSVSYGAPPEEGEHIRIGARRMLRFYHPECGGRHCTQNEVFPNLYIGDYHALFANFKDVLFKNRDMKEYFRKGRFSVVLDLSASNDFEDFKEPGRVFKFEVKDTVDDSSFSVLRESVKETFLAVDNALNEAKDVLFACSAGASRSVTAAILFLMEYRNMSLIDAYETIVSEREIAEPNSGFMKGLLEVDASLNNPIKATKEQLLEMSSKTINIDFLTALKPLYAEEEGEQLNYRYEITVMNDKKSLVRHRIWDFLLFLKAYGISANIVETRFNTAIFEFSKESNINLKEAFSQEVTRQAKK